MKNVDYALFLDGHRTVDEVLEVHRSRALQRQNFVVMARDVDQALSIISESGAPRMLSVDAAVGAELAARMVVLDMTWTIDIDHGFWFCVHDGDPGVVRRIISTYLGYKFDAK